MKKITIREILLGTVAYYMNCSEECLKKYKTYELKEMAERYGKAEINS